MSDVLSREQFDAIAKELRSEADRKITKWDAADGHILLPKEVQVAVEVKNEHARSLPATIEALAEAVTALSVGLESGVIDLQDPDDANRAARALNALAKKGWL